MLHTKSLLFGPPLIFLVILALIGYFGWPGWLGSTQIQAASTFVLVVITGFYARVTHRMMVGADRDRVEAVRPVVAFSLVTKEDARSRRRRRSVREFCVAAKSIGVGPAIDLSVTLQGQLHYSPVVAPRQPIALAVGESEDFCFELNEKCPFGDTPGALKWPRDEEDTELDRKMARIDRRSRPTLRGSQQDKDTEEYERKFNEYRKQLVTELTHVHEFGTLEANYSDVHHRCWTTTRPVVRQQPAKKPSSRQLEYGGIALGETTLSGPVTCRASSS